jgi:serine protease Do
MLVQRLTLGLLFGGLVSTSAETIQLKDKSSISAKILVEKQDQIVVDLGYTVLSIPRTAIAEILKDDAAPKPKTDPKIKTVSATPGEFYQGSKGDSAEKSVRVLAIENGEAVTQVRTPAGLGSGFFVNEEGYLITNFHVIEGETQISVEVYHQKRGQLDRTVYKNVRIIAINKFQDLALLKIEEKEMPKFVKLPLGDSDALVVGETVFAIGSPMGLERTVTEGIISTKTRQLQGQLYLQTTAQINPGNSGGPLFNLRGEVVGVTSMKITGEGIGFAIPVEAVKFFLSHRDAYSYDNDNPSSGYHYLAPPSRLQKPIEKADNK